MNYHYHKNGLGLVSDEADVDDTAIVSRSAVVSGTATVGAGAIITDMARVEDRAVIEPNAYVGGMTLVTGDTIVRSGVRLNGMMKYTSGELTTSEEGVYVLGLPFYDSILIMKDKVRINCSEMTTEHWHELLIKKELTENLYGADGLAFRENFLAELISLINAYQYYLGEIDNER